MNTTLGTRIADLRHKRGLKQDELAEMLGISPQAISKWENDAACPDISLLPRLAEIFEVSVDELLTGKKEQTRTVRMLPENERKDIKDMMLRIVIKSKDGDSIRVNLPLGIIEVAIDSGLSISQFSGNEALRSLDLNGIMNMVKQGAIGNIVEVESADKDKIQVFVE